MFTEVDIVLLFHSDEFYTLFVIMLYTVFAVMYLLKFYSPWHKHKSIPLISESAHYLY